MRTRRRLLALVATAAAAAGLASAATAPAAFGDVEWNGEVLQAPTNLPPGGRGMIRVVAANVGDAVSTAFPTITVELPAGVTLADPAYNELWSCTGVGTSTATCVSDLSFFTVPAFSYVGLAGVVPAGRWLNTSLVVDVAPNAAQGTQPLSVTLDGGGSTVTQARQVRIGSEQLPFGVTPGTFEAGAFDESGADYTQGGGRPYDATASFDLNTAYFEPDPTDFSAIGKALVSKDNLKDVVVDLPPGFVGDPSATPKCAGLGEVANRSCPPASQVGVASVSPPLQSEGRRRMFAIYNIVPERGAPAQFAFFSPVGSVVLTPVVRSDGDMGISVNVKNITQADVIVWTEATLWGVPADPSHDAQRCANPNFMAQACVGHDEANVVETGQEDSYVPHASSAPVKPFLSNPTECSGQSPVTRLHLASWENPGRFEPDGDPDLTDSRWVSAEALAPPVTDCGLLQFDPEISVRPTTSAADSPSGLEFELKLPQNADPNGLATAHLEDTRFLLPEGMRVNPSSADGLDACGAAQIGLTSKSPLRFTKLEPSCPDGSKLGTVEVRTPLLDEPLTGDVFLARQADNPFDSLLAIYLVVRGPGILVKLAGHVEADPRTGRLSTTVLANPQVPFDALKVQLEGGPRAPLTTPATCGRKTAVADLTSWAGHAVEASDSFTIDCTSDPNAFDPSYAAGSTRTIAGAYSPFVMRMTRAGGKELGRIDMTLPKGALANLRGVAVCGDAQIAAATAKPGRVTQSTPSCPAGSRIGSTTAGAGSGPTPFFPTIPGTDYSGRVFLSAPHRGTPFPVAGMEQADYGLAIEVPAVAGPFDLGTVMVRAAIYIDPVTAQIRVVSDQLPRILQGIVLDTRDIRVNVDRPRFATTPTSCAPLNDAADIRAQDGTLARRSSRYQVGDCAALRFKPRLGLRLTGRRQVRTGQHPGLAAVVRQTGLGEAGVGRAEVRLPKSLALDPDNAQALCEFADGTKPDPERRCPKGSIVGGARATSPLLKRPLTGKVFFVKNVRVDRRTGNRIRTLPMIVVALRGEADVNLIGRSNVKGGKLVNTFAAVPDAPISKFELTIKGGGSGIIAVTRTTAGRIDLCSGKQVAQTFWRGQNGMRRAFDVGMKTPCAKRPGKQKRGRR